MAKEDWSIYIYIYIYQGSPKVQYETNKQKATLPLIPRGRFVCVRPGVRHTSVGSLGPTGAATRVGRARESVRGLAWPVLAEFGHAFLRLKEG